MLVLRMWDDAVTIIVAVRGMVVTVNNEGKAFKLTLIVAT